MRRGCPPVPVVISSAPRRRTDGEPEYVTMERGSWIIGISAIGATEQDRFGFWIYVDDADSTLERLRSGAPVVAEPEDQPWGERVARIRDPGGHLVYLGAAL